jgi:hypothetical protein
VPEELASSGAGQPVDHENHPTTAFKDLKTSREIVRLAVVLDLRLPFSLCNVDDLLRERGIGLGHETVRYWRQRFRPIFASETKKRCFQRLKSSKRRWHPGEACVKIHGERQYLWRDVDHEGRGRSRASGAGDVCKSSPPSTPLFQTTSIRNEAFQVQPNRRTVRVARPLPTIADSAPVLAETGSNSAGCTKPWSREVRSIAPVAKKKSL